MNEQETPTPEDPEYVDPDVPPAPEGPQRESPKDEPIDEPDEGDES